MTWISPLTGQQRLIHRQEWCILVGEVVRNRGPLRATANSRWSADASLAVCPAGPEPLGGVGQVPSRRLVVCRSRARCRGQPRSTALTGKHFCAEWLGRGVRRSPALPPNLSPEEVVGSGGAVCCQPALVHVSPEVVWMRRMSSMSCSSGGLRTPAAGVECRDR